jgi:hypothetical protein
MVKLHILLAVMSVKTVCACTAAAWWRSSVHTISDSTFCPALGVRALSNLPRLVNYLRDTLACH